VLCFQAKILLSYLCLLFGYLVLSLCNYFVCTCFFMDAHHHDCGLFRNLYTWEKLHAYWYHNASESIFLLFFILWWLRKEFALWVLVPLYRILCTHGYWRFVNLMLASVSIIIFICNRLVTSLGYYLPFYWACESLRYFIWNLLRILCVKRTFLALCLSLY